MRPGAGVRLGDVALVLQDGHVVADGGRGHAEPVPLGERLGADRLLGADVVLDDGAQHFESAFAQHRAHLQVSSPSPLGLASGTRPFECQRPGPVYGEGYTARARCGPVARRRPLSRADSVAVWTVTWEELGWERLAPGVGRVRLPGWDCTAGLVVGAGGALLVDTGSTPARGRGAAGAGRGAHRPRGDPSRAHPPATSTMCSAPAPSRARRSTGRWARSAVPGGALRADAVRHGTRRGRTAAEARRHARCGPRHLVCGEWTLDLGEAGRSCWSTPAPGTPATTWWSSSPEPPDRGRWSSAATWSRSPASRRPAPTPSRPLARRAGRLLALGGEDALYVPGHGAVVDAAFVRAQRDALAARFGVSR